MGAGAAALAAEPPCSEECRGCKDNEAAKHPALAAVAPEKKERVEIDLTRSPIRGTPGAPITVVVYSDFQCPFCRKGAERIDQLLEKYPGQIQIAFKHFPLAFHDRAPRASVATVAAGNQGKFWEMHDRIFAAQGALDDASLLTHAKALGLDPDRFQRDLEDPGTKARVDADLAEGASLGVRGTPTFFVNGRILTGAQPLQAFTDLISRRED